MAEKELHVVVATYKRAGCLLRLLRCLAEQTRLPEGVWVVDNAEDGALKEEIARFPGLAVHYLSCPGNPGCGAALALGMHAAADAVGLARMDFVVMDDDVIPGPEVLRGLEAGAGDWGMLAPLLTDASGAPEISAEPEAPFWKRRLLRRARSLEEFKTTLGKGLLRFRWCRGPCYWVSGRTVEQLGGPRGDFWMLGEDIEFSMRAADRGLGGICPEVVVMHAPPMGGGDEAGRWHRVKFAAMLQNLAYMAGHLPHCRGCARYLFPHLWRYGRTFGWTWTTLGEILRCLMDGWVHGEPAGGRRARDWRTRVLDQGAVASRSA